MSDDADAPLPPPLPNYNTGGPNTGNYSDILSAASAAGIIAPPQPNYTTGGDPGAGPIPPPVTSASPSPAPGTSVKTGGSISSSGYSSSKFAQVSKDSDPFLAKAGKAANEEAQAMYAPALGALDKAQKQGEVATDAMTRATVDQALASGRVARQQEKLMNDMAAEEAKVNEHYRAEANQSKANYMAALTDLRASRVDPGQLWHNMGAGGQFGMMVTAFVHGFLGAKGVHTDAMDIFNKAIDRNIDAQVQNIKVKGEVAEGFKNLWYMQRSQAASDAEARARVRGFMLDGAKQGVAAYMAQYNASVATAQGQAALAKLDEESAKNLIQVYNHIDNSVIDRKKQAVEVLGIKTKAAMEAQRIAADRDIAAMNRVPLPPPSPTEGKIVDPWTNKFAWKLGDTYNNVKPEERAKIAEGVQKDFGKMKSLDDRIKRLAELAKEANGPGNVLNKSRLANQAQAEFESLATEVAGARARDIDGRVNWQEIEANLKGLRPDKWFGRYDGEKLVSQFRTRVIGGQVDQLRGLVTDLDDTDPARTLGGAAKGGPFGAQTEANVGANPRAPSHDDEMKAQAGKQVESAFLSHPPVLSDPPDDVKTEVGNFKAQYTQAYDKTKDFKETLAGKPGERVLEWEEGLVRTRDLAAKGDKEEHDKLVSLAREYLSPAGGADSSPESIFATMMLYELHADNPTKFPDPTADVERFNKEH